MPKYDGPENQLRVGEPYAIAKLMEPMPPGEFDRVVISRDVRVQDLSGFGATGAGCAATAAQGAGGGVGEGGGRSRLVGDGRARLAEVRYGTDRTGWFRASLYLLRF